MPRTSRMTAKSPGKVRADASPVEFARIHVVMVFLLLLFFGILIVPYCVRKIRCFHYRPVEARVVNVIYTDDNNTIVEFEYTSRGKSIRTRDIFNQSLRKGDTFLIYVDHYSPENHMMTNSRQPVWIILLILYCLLVVYCLYLLWHTYMGLSTGAPPKSTKRRK